MPQATAHPDRRLISSEDVQGTDVYGVGDEAIGEIDHLLIDKVSGRVVYAVMSFGGFLGLGHSHYPIPWSALKYDTNLGVIEQASRRSNCEMRPNSVMTHGKIAIGRHERINTMVHPPIGALDRWSPDQWLFMKLTEDDLEALRARIDRGHFDGHE